MRCNSGRHIRVRPSATRDFWLTGAWRCRWPYLHRPAVSAGANRVKPGFFDSATGRLEPFEASGATPRAAVVAVSPDGRGVAYLQAAQAEMQRGRRSLTAQ